MPIHRHVLHISDLHRAAGDLGDQDVVIDAFIEDLKVITSHSARPDIVLFTGDIARAGDSAGDYDRAIDDVERILRTLDVEHSRVIFCPGNHDASRSFVFNNRDYLRTYRQKATERNSVNELFSSDEFRDFTRLNFAKYNEFVSLFESGYRSYQSPYSEVYVIPEIELGVVSLNSACLSFTGLHGEQNDRGYLAIGEHVLRQSLREVPTNFCTIVAGHHPLDWLNEENSQVVTQILSASASAYLHGHMHDAQPKLVRGLSGSCVMLQSGGIFIGRASNAYSVVSLGHAPDITRVTLRSYYPKREAFGIGEDQIDGGVFYASEEARQYWLQHSARDVRADWYQRTLIPFLETQCDETVSTRPLTAVFVDPEFERDVPLSRHTPIRMGSETEIATYRDLLSSDENYIISGSPESGRTSLLRQWALSAARGHCGQSQSRLIPIFLKFSEIPTYPARYRGLIRSKLPELPEGQTIDEVIDQEGMIFLIDDADLKDSKRLDHLKEFLGHFRASRFVITSSRTLLSSPGVQPVIGDDVRFEAVRLRPLRIGQLRLLVERHGIEDPEQGERLISRIYEEMQSLAVPLTPVTSTFLIQVYKDNETTTFVNRASLIERFIETLLDRYAIQDVLPGSFDFRNKAHVLAYLAERMVRSSNFEPRESLVLEWLGSYLKEFGFRHTAHDLLSYFLSSRVLQRSGDEVAFKFRAFFSYFCALQMSHSREFKEFVLSGDGHLKFIEELGFYGAIARDDVDTLQTLWRRFKDTFTLRRSGAGEGVSLEIQRLQDLRLPPLSDKEDDIYSIEEQIFSRRLESDERDKLLYGDADSSQFDNQKIVKHQPDTESVRSISQLMALSLAVRHMDLVPDAVKREIVRDLVDGWIEFALLSLALVPDLATKGRIRFEGIEYRINFPEGMSTDQIARNIFITMPITIGRQAFQHLGTEKLATQLAHGIGSTEEPIERQMMRFFILADVGTKDTPRAARALAPALMSFRYLSTVMLAKLNDTLVRFNYSEEQSRELRELAASVLVRLTGKTGREATERKGRVINVMRRHEMALRLKFQERDRREAASDVSLGN